MAGEDPNYPGMSDDDASPAMPGKDKEGAEEVGETSLLPKSFFAGKDPSPGDQCMVEVMRVHGDECEVKYVKHDEAAEPEEPSVEGVNGRLDSMSKGY